MNLEGLELIQLDQSTILKPFACEDDSLRDFLISKAKEYQKELLAVTYILQDDVRTIAYFSIFNDSLKVQEEDFASKSSLKRFLSNLVSHPKRHLEDFPALKIGRLAVCNDRKKSGLGTTIFHYILNQVIEINKISACKLITVDAYATSLGFYEKMNFTYLSENDKGDETRQMYIDITPFVDVAEDLAE